MVLFGCLSLAAFASAHAAQPHIMLIVGDDVGYNSVGFHGNNPEVQTPRMDSLTTDGVIFDRMYAFCWCSPSRASIMSGRLPAHVYQNAGAPVLPDAGLPLGMTTLANKLKAQGYATVHAGKWHLGFGRENYIPVERGFDSSFGFFGGAENHFNQTFCSDNLCMQAYGNKLATYDLWLDHDAAYGLMSNDTSLYGDARWTKHVIDFIDANPSKPIFAYLALAAAHSPLQAPDEALDVYDDSIYTDRRLYAGMMTALDTNIGRLVDHLEAKEMWSNTFLLFVSDNGGPVYYNAPGASWQGGAGSNNYPLRGGKLSLLEGGMRVTSFAAGGALPLAARGSHVPALAAIADIYATLAILGGADLSDASAQAAGLPEVDGVDLMPVLKGEAASARNRLTLALNFSQGHDDLQISQHASAIIDGDLKLITGKVAFYFDQSPTWPESAYPWVWDDEHYLDCGDTGCLFDIMNDPSETQDLASERPHDLVRMQQLLSAELAKQFEADVGKLNPINIVKFKRAVKQRNGIAGPFASSIKAIEV